MFRCDPLDYPGPKVTTGWSQNSADKRKIDPLLLSEEGSERIDTAKKITKAEPILGLIMAEKMMKEQEGPVDLDRGFCEVRMKMTLCQVTEDQWPWRMKKKQS